MADALPRPGTPKTATGRTALPDLPARADLDRARVRARVAGDTAGTPDRGGTDRPSRSMPVLRWKDRLGG